MKSIAKSALLSVSTKATNSDKRNKLKPVSFLLAESGLSLAFVPLELDFEVWL